jgi:hypothetical protein
MVFIGDTGTRQVFRALIRKVEGESWWDFPEEAGRNTHGDIDYEYGNIRLKFIWDPWLNGTILNEELRHFKERNTSKDVKNGGTLTMEPKSASTSVLMFIGGGMWHARHLGNEGLSRFKLTVDRIAAAARSGEPTLENLRAKGPDGIGDQIVFAPVFEPLYDRLSPAREATILPIKIQAMNAHLGNQSARGLNVPWAYRYMTKGWPELVGDSGMHVDALVSSKMADIILNFWCNAKATQKHGYPFNTTCCSAERRRSWVQIIAQIFFLPSFISPRIRPGTTDSITDKLFGFSIFGSPVVAAARHMCLAAYYCFIADRTHVFDKFPKEFAYTDFVLVMSVALIICLASFNKMPPSSTNCGSGITSGPHMRSSFLPREQSDELKGYMQLYVLIYEYTGASKDLRFYEMFRICVSFYLFLSAYGHTMYFIQTRDFSLKRVFAVLLRFNTTPVILAFALSRPYASYGSVPLVSFWFLLVYATLKIGKQYNDSFWHLMGKIVVAMSLVTGFVHIKGTLELPIGSLCFLFRADIDVDQWRFHLGMDKYVAFVGMLVAILHNRIASTFETPSGQLCFGDYVIKRYFSVIQAHFIAFALVGVPGFWILIRRSLDEADFNWWIPYISWLPIVSVVVLRNTNPFLRTHYCALLAQLGRISLELYLLSNHIWMAGNGRGVLRIGFRSGDGGLLHDRWRDLVVLTPIFLWFAWKIHVATKIITAWVMETDQRMKPVGLGIECLDGHKSVGVMARHGNYSTNTKFGVPSIPDTHTGGLGRPTWRLPVVVAGVWLVNTVSSGLSVIKTLAHTTSSTSELPFFLSC